MALGKGVGMLSGLQKYKEVEGNGPGSLSLRNVERIRFQQNLPIEILVDSLWNWGFIYRIRC